MNNKKGFTLVEVLATVTLIAIIAVISVPSILKAIESGQKNTFQDSATGLLESATLYNSEHAGEITKLDLSNTEQIRKLKFKGTPPKGGSLYIDENGNMALEMYDNKHCATKNIYDQKVSIVKFSNISSCKSNYEYDKQNLILHYDGINNTGNGHDINSKVWFDLSKNNNSGELINFIPKDQWKMDSLKFNGINNYINLGNKLINLFKGSMTLEIVANFDSTQLRGIILGNYPTSNSINIEKGYSVNQGRIYYKDGGVNYFTPNDYIGSNKMNSYTFVLNKSNNTFNFYRNGIYKYQTSSSIFSNNLDFSNAKIGIDGRGDYKTVALKATIASIRIYNKALNQEQITKNYKIDENRFKLG